MQVVSKVFGASDLAAFAESLVTIQQDHGVEQGIASIHPVKVSEILPYFENADNHSIEALVAPLDKDVVRLPMQPDLYAAAHADGGDPGDGFEDFAMAAAGEGDADLDAHLGGDGFEAIPPLDQPAAGAPEDNGFDGFEGFEHLPMEDHDDDEAMLDFLLLLIRHHAITSSITPPRG